MRAASTSAPPKNKPDDIEIDKAELDRLNQEMITSDLITPDRLYVDLALCRDYNIGALLAFHHERRTTQSIEQRRAIYQSLLDGIPAYQERKFDDLAHYFPAFAVSNAELQARLQDPRWSSYILHHAPTTLYLELLRSQIAVNINHSSVIGKRDPIEMTVNTYPMHLSEVDRHIVGLYFSETFRVNVKVIYLDMRIVTTADILLYDEFYTYHFIELFKQAEIRASYTALKFIRKRLYAPRIFGQTIDPAMDVDREELILRTRCDILTMFTLIPARLFSAIPPEDT